MVLIMVLACSTPYVMVKFQWSYAHLGYENLQFLINVYLYLK